MAQTFDMAHTSFFADNVRIITPAVSFGKSKSEKSYICIFAAYALKCNGLATIPVIGGITMGAKITNPNGTIIIGQNAFARIAGLAATDCSGVLGLASADGGWMDLLKKDSVDKGVRVSFHDGAVVVEISIIARYGVSLAATAENIIETVRYRVEDLTGTPVARVNVVVRGIRV